MEITASENDLYIYMKKSEVGGGERRRGGKRGRGRGRNQWKVERARRRRAREGSKGRRRKWGEIQYTLRFCLLTPAAQLPLQLFTDTLFPLSRTM